MLAPTEIIILLIALKKIHIWIDSKQIFGLQIHFTWEAREARWFEIFFNHFK